MQSQLDIRTIATELIGPPNRRLSSKQELRFGRKGSLSIVVFGNKAGCWFDHENAVGGGPIDLVMRYSGRSRGEAISWLNGKWR